MPVRTPPIPRTPKKAGPVKRISHRQSLEHADQAFEYFRRNRARFFRNPLYRGRYIAIRDRQVVDVDDDKFVLHHRLAQRFPDYRFVVSQVLHELPTIDMPD